MQINITQIQESEITEQEFAEATYDLQKQALDIYELNQAEEAIELEEFLNAKPTISNQ